MTARQVSRQLARKLLRGRHTRIMMDYFREKLPKLECPDTPEQWQARACQIRQDLLQNVYLRGHKPGIIDAAPKVQWRGVINSGKGYRIRKLRYEGYPGMWIPALLYEPVPLRGKVPAVLNPNGHHRGGKAMPYKQARCINLAKKGMLALNTEFVGMGELQGCANHMQQGHLDLCGVAGVGVMYLAMKRGLDVLLAQRHTDPERVAMTGLSGGGWQTAVLSAIDERIRAVLPVSGHSPIWHRATVRWSDHGDLEQTPVDLCTVADYDTLTAMFAPRPALLVHSVNDSIFRPEFMRGALFRPAREVYRLLGVPKRIGFYANHDPGTHNYEKDIREQLYAFLRNAWGLDISTDDVPCDDDEIRSERELSVGLPPGNPNYLQIASELAGNLPRQRASAQTKEGDRHRLETVLHLPDTGAPTVEQVGQPQELGGATVTHHLLSLGRWRMPVSEFSPLSPSGTELLLSDAGRPYCAALVRDALRRGRRAVVTDVFGFGEQTVGDGAYRSRFMECVAAAGDRALGLSVAQLLALLRWLNRQTNDEVGIVAQGLSSGLVALCAAALRPKGIASLDTNLPDTLKRLIDWQTDYLEHPVIFCFGLLEQFDIDDLILLSDPVAVTMPGRGPMR